MKALLLPSISSVKFFLKKKNKYKNFILCTDSSSVKVFCEFNLKIKCIDINDYFSTSKRNAIYYKLYKNYLKKLKKCDLILTKNLSEREKEFYNNWIYHLYRYFPFFYYFGLFNFQQSLKKFLFIKKIKHLVVYKDFKSSHFLFSNEDIVKVIVSLKKIKFKFIENNSFNKNSYFAIYKKKLKEIIKHSINTLKNYKFYLKKIFNKKENIIIVKPIYEIDLKKFNEFNIYFLNESNFKTNFTTGNLENSNIKKNFFSFNKNNIVEKIIFKKIANHYNENSKNFFSYIKNFSQFIKKNKIKKLIWGLPPIHANQKVLIVKYLQKIKIPVIGYQHGGCYGDLSMDDFHYLSDYNYCDIFYCYKKDKLSFTKHLVKDYKLCKFNTAGSLRVKKNFYSNNYSKKYKKKILFPITCWTDNFSHMLGDSSREVVKRQIFILRLLKKLNLKVVIKYIKNTDSFFNETSYPAYYLSNFNRKNFIFEYGMSLQTAINFYKPDLVILDTISTPLYETIINDCDIICFNSKFNKLKKNVEKKINKRVYVANSDKQLLKFINDYKTKKLSKKRDESFLRENLLNN